MKIAKQPNKTDKQSNLVLTGLRAMVFVIALVCVISILAMLGENGIPIVIAILGILAAFFGGPPIINALRKMLGGFDS